MEIKLDLKGFTTQQYAMLILRDDLKYSWARCGRRLGISRHAARMKYKRALCKEMESTS